MPGGAFVDAVVAATRIVDHTSQQEKVDALRNAVLNSAMPTAPDQEIQQPCLGLIEDLTPTHIKLLALLDDPPGWFDRRPNLAQPRFALSSNRIMLISDQVGRSPAVSA